MVPMTFKKRSCLESIRRAHDLMVLKYRVAAKKWDEVAEVSNFPHRMTAQ